jgi:hypothetical protein
MFTLSATPVIDEYNIHLGTECMLGKNTVKVCRYANESCRGSYERGFKFSTNIYGYLTKQLKGTKYYKPLRYSHDHGKTWFTTFGEMKKQRSGKVRVSTQRRNEFAFDRIQQINRSYIPNYKWHA